MASQQIHPSDLPPSNAKAGQSVLVLNAPPTDDKDLIASIERKEFCIEVGKERQYHEWFFEGSTSRFVARITSKSTGCRSLEVESQTRQRVNLVFASVNKDLPAWFYSAAEMEGPEDLEFFRKQNEECRLIYGHAPLPNWTAPLEAETIAFRDELDSLFAKSNISADETGGADRLTQMSGSISKSAASAASQQMSIGTGQPDETDISASAESQPSQFQSSGFFLAWGDVGESLAGSSARTASEILVPTQRG